MPDRWTQKELENYDDIDFAIIILQERYNKLSNIYSPLSQKIKQAQNTLEKIKEMEDKIITLNNESDYKEFDDLVYKYCYQGEINIKDLWENKKELIEFFINKGYVKLDNKKIVYNE